MLFLFLITLLAGRLVYLQVWQSSRYTQLAQAQRLRPTVIDARRGSILDRNYKTLAVSAGAYAVYVLPHLTRDPVATAMKLAPYLAMSKAEIAQVLTDQKTNIWLTRKLPIETAKSIDALGLPGIRLLERPQRFYPQGTLAAQVLGIAGIDNQGLEGLEFYYNQYLQGTPGRLEKERDATQREIPGGIERLIPPTNGYDLILTIDSTIQYIAEREIESAVLNSNSDSGIILIVNPNTGEIYANAIYPTFDPNNYQSYPTENRRNVSVTDQYEPGSTFKIFTAASALDSGITTQERSFYSGRSWSVGGGAVRSWNGTGHGQISFLQAVENSDNITFAQLAVEMKPELFHPYLAKFGFGERMGIDYPGEGRGVLPKPGQIRHGELLQWANIGFGQGVAVTPLQLIMATAAVANGGALLRPYYVAEIRDERGKVIERTQPHTLAEPISQATSKEMLEILRSAVVNGSGGRAEIIGFHVAGKTGTAEVPEQGGYGDKRIASFVGFAPANDPAIVALVALHNPQTDVRFGGVLAAPVFQKVAEQTLEYLGIKRRKASTEQSIMTVVPNVRNFPLADARQSILQAGLQWSYENPGQIVIDQIPGPGSRVAPQTTINLYFYDEINPTIVTIPNLIGHSMRDASAILSEIGLRLRIIGSGMAHRQTPQPGTKVPVGSVIEVEFLR